MTVGFFDEILGRMVFRRVVVDQESVPVPGDQMLAAAGVEEDQAPAPRLPPVRGSLAAVIKAACAMREAGQSRWGETFRWDDEQHRKARAWVGSLSETQIVSIRHMPLGRLEQHLATDCSVRLSLPTWLHFDRHAYARQLAAAKAERAVQDRRRREKVNRMLGIRPDPVLDDG